MAWLDFKKEVDEVVEDGLPEAFSGYDLIWGGADLNINIQ